MNWFFFVNHKHLWISFSINLSILLKYRSFSASHVLNLKSFISSCLTPWIKNWYCYLLYLWDLNKSTGWLFIWHFIFQRYTLWFFFSVVFFFFIWVHALLNQNTKGIVRRIMLQNIWNIVQVEWIFMVLFNFLKLKMYCYTPTDNVFLCELWLGVTCLLLNSGFL